MSLPANSRYYAAQHKSTFTSNPSISYPTDPKTLDLMFHQVKSLVRQLLQEVSLIYKQCRIVFPIHQYTDPILRMISPVELYSLVNTNYLQYMFEHNNFYRSGVNQNKKIKQIRIQKFRNNTNEMMKFKQPTSSHPNSKIIGSEQLYGIAEQSQDKYEGSIYSQLNLQKKGRHTVRSRGLEGEIATWVVTELQSGRLVTKPLIMQKARQLGRSFRFKACPRWCDNFLNRNPDLKALVYRRLYEQSETKLKTSIARLSQSDIQPQSLKQGYQEDLRTFSHKMRDNIKQKTTPENEDEKKYEKQNYKHGDGSKMRDDIEDVRVRQKQIGFDMRKHVYRLDPDVKNFDDEQEQDYNVYNEEGEDEDEDNEEQQGYLSMDNEVKISKNEQI